MIENFFAETKQKPYSCPLNNSSTSCTVNNYKKKASKPNIFNEEPKSFQVPVLVGYFKQKQIRFQDFTKRNHWRTWRLRQPHNESIPEKFNLCRWYKRRRALKSLRDQNKREQEKEKNRRREEYERESINDILRWEYGKQLKAAKETEIRKKRDIYEREERLNDLIRSEYQKKQTAAEETERKKREKYEKERNNYIIRLQNAKQHETIAKYKPRLRFFPPKEEEKEVVIKETRFKPRPWSHLKYNIHFQSVKNDKKRAFVKEKSATAKPRAQTKQVSVKKYKPKHSLTNRFVNCCYRICCQFYCCLTCILIIAFAIVLLL